MGLDTNFDLFRIFSKRAGKRCYIWMILVNSETIQPTGSSGTDRL